MKNNYLLNKRSLLLCTLFLLLHSYVKAQQVNAAGWAIRDASWSQLAQGDDISTSELSLPFDFCFYQNSYNKIYVNENGNVTFSRAWPNYIPSFPLQTPMIAPFWCDVDTRYVPVGRVYYKIFPNCFIVQWDSVVGFQLATTLRNSFQLIISDGSSPLIPNGNNISFTYKNIQWTTGTASNGVPAIAGTNIGDNVNYSYIGRYHSSASGDNGPNGISGLSAISNRTITLKTCWKTLYVDSSRSVDGDGTSWGNAFKYLSSALKVAQSNIVIDSILVAKGTYYPTGATISSPTQAQRDSSFVIKRNKLKLLGGYPNGGGSRNTNINPVILSGDIDNTPNDSSKNSYHIMCLTGISGTDSLHIDGFRFHKGSANASTNSYYSNNGISFNRRNGGALYIRGNDSSSSRRIAFYNCSFTDNYANYNGGAIYDSLAHPTFGNCVFVNNRADSSGGVLYNYLASPIINNVTIVNNRAINGGAITNYASTPGINNTIIWGNTANTAASVYNSFSIPRVNNSLIQAYTYTASDMDNLNTTTAPLFYNISNLYGADGILGTSDDGLRLLPCSPAINAGNNLTATRLSTDISGSPRIYNNAIVDMGAYEYQGDGLGQNNNDIYVDSANGNDANSGYSWANAFKTLSYALYKTQPTADSLACYRSARNIHIAKGTYYPTGAIVSNPTQAQRDSSFLIKRRGLILYGGYPNGGGTRDAKQYPVILSGDIDNTPNDSSSNVYHIMVLSGANGTDSIVLDGLTFKKGSANATTNSYYSYNGINVSRCNGGALCLITNDSSNTMLIAIKNCLFTDNYARLYGGAVYDSLLHANYSHSVFTQNRADSSGAAVYNSNARPTFLNSIFYNNTALHGGAMGNMRLSQAVIVNCNFVKNRAAIGGAIYDGNAKHNMYNTVVWENTASIHSPSLYNDPRTGSFTIVYNSLVQNYAYNVWDSSNLPNTYNPIFLNSSNPVGADNIWGTADDGLQVQACSPLINTGRNSSISGYNITTDFIGNPRIYNADRTDIGAYEYQGSTSNRFTKVYVDSLYGSDANAGTSWNSAFKSLSFALYKIQQNDCYVADSILVAKGIYYPTGITITDPTQAERDSSFMIKRSGIKLYAGYPNGGGIRNTVNNPVILSGDIDNTPDDSTKNSYHIMSVVGIASSMDSVIVDGFIFQKGSANATSDTYYTANNISLNKRNGGALYLRGNDSAMSRLFAFRHCVFTNNYANQYGGAVYDSLAHAAFHNCLFVNNKSANIGAALYNQGASPLITNGTFAANSAVNGAAIANTASSPLLRNTIVWGNTASSGAAGIYNSGSSPDIQNSLVESYSYTATDFNNLPNATNPQFYNLQNAIGNDNRWGTADDGLQLLFCSPAMNTGNNSYIAAGVLSDIQGNMRIYNNGVVDMGAYEYPGTFASYNKVYVDSLYGNDIYNNGFSWNRAFKTLSKALAQVQQSTGCYMDIDSILVAKGTYYPTGVVINNPTQAQRDSSFIIKRGSLKLYAGYPNGGGARNVLVNPVILSGDIDNSPNDSSNNSYHIMLVTGITTDSVVVDGFVFKKGSANAASDSYYSYNGALFNRRHGGALYISYNDSANSRLFAVRNCSFKGSYAALHGAAIYDSLSHISVRKCNFIENRAAGFGAAVYIATNTSPQIHTSGFIYNRANSGAAIYNRGNLTLIINSVFTNNVATNGGAIYNLGGSPSIINTTIANNTANTGGGIYNISNSTPAIRNSIIWGNTASSGGPGISNNSSIPSVRNSLVQAYTYLSGDLNNIANTSDPFFENVNNPLGDDNVWGTWDDGLRLQMCSPALNAGSNDFVPTNLSTDYSNLSRIYNNTVDMGAYERQDVVTYFRKIFVDSLNGNDNNHGFSWSSAFKTLSFALRQSQQSSGCYMNVDSILVAKGTYYPIGTIAPSPTQTQRDSSFVIKRGRLKIYGGYPNGGGTRDVTNNRAILSGDIDNTPADISNNTRHLMVLCGLNAATDSIIIDGISFEKGNAAYMPARYHTVNGVQLNYSRGGAVYILKNDTVASKRFAFRNCVFRSNFADDYGAGIYDSMSYSSFHNCAFTDNFANNGGAAIAADRATASINNCRLTNNTAYYRGGAIYADRAIINIKASQIDSNISIYATGGAMCNSNSKVLIQNSNFNANTSSYYEGGAIANYSSALIIDSCNFTNNTNRYYGGALYLSDTNTVISNSKFLNNSSGLGGAIYLTGLATVNNSVFSGNLSSNGAAFYMAGGRLNLTNNILVHNTAQAQGGAIYHVFGPILITNNTIAHNNAQKGAGISANASVGSCAIQNTIIWANKASISDSGVFKNNNVFLNVYNSLIQGYNYTGTDSANLPNTLNPLFVNVASPIGPDSIWGTSDDGLLLSNCSPAINAGQNVFLPSGNTTDILGNTRIYNNSVVDMGAYEKQVTVSPESQAVLSNSSSNNLQFIPTCVQNEWTWYAGPSNADSLSFAIKWGTNNTAAKATAVLQLNVDSLNVYSSTSAISARAAMRRYWNINLNGTSLSEPVSIRFYYNPADTLAMYHQLASGGTGLVQALKWVKTTQGAYHPNLVSDTQFNNGNYQVLTPTYGSHNGVAFVQFDNLTSFSGGTATMDAGEAEPLSLELLSFRGSIIAASSLLEWTTGNEEGVLHYQLERSADAQQWSVINEQAARHDAINEYKYNDRQPVSGNNYYRLRYTNADGITKQSRVLMLRFAPAEAASFKLYPNPSDGTFRVMAQGSGSANAVLQITDVLGRSIHRGPLHEGENECHIRAAPGIYQVLITSDTETYSEQLWIK